MCEKKCTLNNTLKENDYFSSECSLSKYFHHLCSNTTRVLNFLQWNHWYIYNYTLKEDKFNFFKLDMAHFLENYIIIWENR